MKKISGLSVLVLLIAFSLACGLIDQTDEANKLVDQANAVIEKNNDIAAKSDELFVELMGGNLAKVTDIEAYKKENKSKFDELINLNEQIEEMRNQAVNKFEEASKLKVQEKYKDYLNLKIQEMKKRGDSQKLVIPFVKSFLETNDVEKINAQIEDYDSKSAELEKEADELLKKVEQFQKDNPGVFDN